MSEIPELKLIPESIRREIEERINGPEDAREAQERHRLWNSCIRGEMSNLMLLAEAVASQLRRELRIRVGSTQKIRNRETDLLSTAIWPHMLDRFRQERESLQQVDRATEHEIDLFGRDFPVNGSPGRQVVIEMQEQMRRGWPAAVMIVWSALCAELQLQQAQLKANMDQQSAGNTQDSAPVLHGTFVKEGETWAIEYAGETCRLPVGLLGLDYISVLLRYPGRPMRALELLSVVAGNPMASRPASKRAADDVTANGSAYGDEDKRSGSPGRASPNLYSDAIAIRDYERQLTKLEAQATAAYNAGEKQKGDELLRKYDEIDSHLKKSLGRHHRPRAFADDSEKARLNITKAIQRAVTKIRLQAPETAKYLKARIQTGSEFAYLDNSLSWKL